MSGLVMNAVTRCCCGIFGLDFNECDVPLDRTETQRPTHTWNVPSLCLGQNHHDCVKEANKTNRGGGAPRLHVRQKTLVEMRHVVIQTFRSSLQTSV